MFWALVNLLFHGLSMQAWLVFFGMASTRVVTSLFLSNRYLHAGLRLQEALLIPLKDLLVSAIWFIAFTGDHVQWSGHAFRVRTDGEIVDLASPPLVSDRDTLG
jgi:hypothetical protein